MAIHGKDARVLCNGVDLSGYFRSAALDREVDLIDVTTFGASAKRYKVGFEDGKASLEGLYDSKAEEATAALRNAIDDVLSPLLGADTAQQLVLVAPAGVGAYGDVCNLFVARQTKYSIASPISGVVSAMAELQATNQGISFGHMAHPHATRTAGAAGTSHDGLAATAAGAVADIHVTAAAGTAPTLNVLVEDSADNAIWATVGTFAAKTAGLTSERLVIAGTVRRYVRVSWTVGGTAGPSFAFAVGFARLRA